MMQPHIRSGLLFIGGSTILGVVGFVAIKLGRDVGNSQRAAEGTELTATAEEQGGEAELSATSRQCGSGKLAIEVGEGPEGVVELLTAIAESDGLNSTVLDVQEGQACIDRSELVALDDATGGEMGELEMLVTYDPRGRPRRYRSVLEFLPDYAAGEETGTPIPRDLRVGYALWQAKGGSQKLDVTWTDSMGVLQDRWPQPRYADLPENSTSIEYQACLDNAGGVTVAMRDCAAVEYERVDRLLNSTYQQVMAREDEEGRRQLRSLQRLWIEVRDSKCELQSRVEEGGTLGLTIYDDCMINETIERTRWLEEY